MTRSDMGEDAAVAAARRQELADPTGDRRGELPVSGSASCIEVWTSMRPIVDQAVFAFDGIVLAIESPGLSNRPGFGWLNLVSVTFRVGEWFAGGAGPEAVVDMDPPMGPHRRPDGDLSYALGSRLLVSGAPRWGGAPLEQPIAWGCGFTRYYDRETALHWRTGG